jgi:RNA-binding protein YlmH
MIEVQEDLNLETSEDSIFHKLEKKMSTIEKATNKEEIKRAEYINDNFDTILTQLLKNKVNVFFKEEFERKGDCKKL